MSIRVKEAGLWGSSKPNVSESSPAYHGVDIKKLNKVRELMKTHAPSVTLAADPISEDWFHVVHNHPKHGPAVMSYGADILDHALSDNDPYDFVGQMKKLHKEQSQKTASINSMALRFGRAVANNPRAAIRAIRGVEGATLGAGVGAVGGAIQGGPGNRMSGAARGAAGGALTGGALGGGSALLARQGTVNAVRNAGQNVASNAAQRMMTPKIAGLNADVICRVFGLDD